MEAVPANRLKDVQSWAIQASVIGIDEGQFVSVLCNNAIHFAIYFAIITCLSLPSVLSNAHLNS